MAWGLNGSGQSVAFERFVIDVGRNQPARALARDRANELSPKDGRLYRHANDHDQRGRGPPRPGDVLDRHGGVVADPEIDGQQNELPRDEHEEDQIVQL